MYSTVNKIKYVLGFIWVFFTTTQLLAQDFTIPEKPNFQTSVYDGAGLLSVEQKTTLEQKLIQYADSTSTQIVVVTVKSLQGNDPSYTAAQWAHKWGIGQADKDNGIMVLVASEDRKMTIQVGYGLEHLLTDAYSRRIIEQIMAPHFRQQDYYGGLNEATNAMMQIFSGEYQNDSSPKDSGVLLIVFFILFMLFIILIIYLASKNAKHNGSGNDDDFFGPIILSRGGRSTWGGGFGGGSWGGGSSGGGFGGGFGGGGFGGGGASGGW